jgi:hypothetical protein
MPQHPLITISESLRPFDQRDLQAAVAGLQLMPEYADQTPRLEALAQAVALLPNEEGPSTPTIWQRIAELRMSPRLPIVGETGRPFGWMAPDVLSCLLE